MLDQYSFTIYNASAGSGKTFTLVKEYLKILFQSNTKDAFKHILAITFTNKAVGEMKNRIIDKLSLFSSEGFLNTQDDTFDAIVSELSMHPKALHEKSKSVLQTIIYNYAAFDISTIDGFTHKLIRTFAHDLKLPVNFEVELDQDAVLNEAVDNLIAKAGTDTKLTQILVDFAIEKTDEDKSWDISYDFNKIAKLLINENDIPYINKLKDKSLEDFKTLKTQLRKDLKIIEDGIVEHAQKVLTLIEEASLQHDDFSRSALPKHFEKLKNKNFDVNFESSWQMVLINNEALYPKRATPEIASIIDAIQEQLIIAFNTTKESVYRYRFLKSFYKNTTPLSVLNAINQELIHIKREQNKMLISEFNTIISNEIKNQPTPFIYERLGEKFRHYFIDEFQDTSTLQWQNLIPLIDNNLSGQNFKQDQGTAMLVGDAKQAIYRWRGGKAEQFIDLYSKKVLPFPYAPQHIENLPTNYRSYKEIIAFNNSFFSYLAKSIFTNKDYSELYSIGANQESFIDQDGFVSIDFLDIKKEDNRNDIYPKKVLDTINNCLNYGYTYKDICVLVRKKKEGIAIAQFLNDHGIKIISSETMLVYNSPEVQFVDSFLKLLLQPNNNEIKIEVLNYLVDHFNIVEKHDYFANHLKLSSSQLFKSFETFNVHLKAEKLLQLPLYDLIERIIRHFNLIQTSNAYLQFYLDFVLEYSQKQGSDLSGFLEHFSKKKEVLNIVSPQGQNAVQVMTIHKSKGLEFPVVIFPYADLDIKRELDAKEWFPIEKDHFNGFSYTLLNYNKDFKNFGEEGQRIYNLHESELELDNINLLYVALTRPIEHLYIISKKDISSKGIINTKTYAGLLLQYLQHTQQYNESQLTYTFGTPKRLLKNSTSEVEPIIHSEFISTAKETHNIKIITNSGYLWDTNQQDAIEKGNLVHNIMSHIKTKSDINFVINEYLDTSIINLEQAKSLQEIIYTIVNHPELASFYTTTSDQIIFNERDIITNTGEILRPDRIIINPEKEVVIIDYKTGLVNKKHMQQLTAYQKVLESMHYTVKLKVLIYINDAIHIVKE